MSNGYIYIPNWEKFQHPDVVRSSRMPWIRDYVAQLEDDDDDGYLQLPLAYRAGLQDIRRLVAANGQGRCSARAEHLQRRCRWPAGWAQKIVDRLSHDGFIEVRACKAPAPVKQPAGLEGEGSKEPKKEIESARANGAAENGSDAAHQKELLAAIRTATTWLEDDPRPLVEHTIHDAWPDFADEVIAGLPKEDA
jgi:hypothetical protein